MKFKQQQYTFSAGELDPLVYGRSDLDRYFSGAETMQNVLPLPQGGFERSPGTEYIATLYKQPERISSGVTITAPNGGTTANVNDDDETTELTTTTQISTTDGYVVVHYDLGSAQTVLFADVVEMRLLNSSTALELDDEIYIQYSTDDSVWTSVGDPIPVSNPSLAAPVVNFERSRRKTGPITARYWRVARIGSTDLGARYAGLMEFTLWTASSSLSGSRLAYFNASLTERFLLIFTSRNVAIYKSGVFQTNVRTPYTSDQLTAIDWAHKQDSLIVVHQSVAPQILQRQGSDDEWMMRPIDFSNEPVYRFTESSHGGAATVTPSAVSGNVTLTAASSVFLSTDVNQYFKGNGGLARIRVYTSGTAVEAVVIIPFYNTSAIASGSWTVQTGYAASWSTARGYPKTVTFYDGRLWFGGTTDLPSNIWASTIADPFDFDLGQNYDDEAIEVQIEASEVPEIVALHPGRNLQIFTSTMELYVPQTAGNAITPNNITIKEGTGRGSKKGLRPQSVSGTTMFVQAEGKAVRDFVFIDTEQAYQANSISAFNSHLLKNPRDMVLRKATSTSEADLLVIVNETDGSLAIMSRLRDQNVAGWVSRTTPGASGSFLQCGIEGNDLYFVTERWINSVQTRFLEKFSASALLDCSVVDTDVSASTSSVTGLDHLDTTTVKVIGDNINQADKIVSSGSITLGTAVTSSYQVGLDYTPTVVPMPVAQQLQDGTMLGKKKRIAEVTLILYQTRNMTINGNEVSLRNFGDTLLDVAIPLFTGQKIVEGILGWSTDGQVTISQSVPAEMTVSSIELKIQI